MVTFLGSVLFPPPVEIREHPEFHDLVEMDKSSWPRCLLWHGWLPLLSGVSDGSPLAESPREGASNLLEFALGRYSSDVLVEWQFPVGFHAEGAAVRVAADLMSGLMGAWWRTRSLVPPLLGRVVLLFAAIVLGLIGGGVIWMRM